MESAILPNSKMTINKWTQIRTADDESTVSSIPDFCLAFVAGHTLEPTGGNKRQLRTILSAVACN